MTETSNVTTKNTISKKKMPTWKKVLIGIGIFIIIAVVGTLVATDVPAQTSDKFVNNILGNNSSLAYDMMSDGAKDTVTQDEFADIVNRMSSVLVETANQQERKIETQNGVTTASVTYLVAGSDGNYTLIVNLIEEKGVWKVQNFDNTVNK